MQRDKERDSQQQSIDRSILRLAVPALGALVAEPLFVLADTAIVGRLGTSALAALSIASTVLLTVVGLCVFLAYATTAAVARQLGAGQTRAALRRGVDGLWLGLIVGVVLAAVLIGSARPVLRWMGASGEVLTLAHTYLTWSAVGLPGMLVLLAATGVLRGLQDTRTPLIITVTGSIANALLNWALVFGLSLGIAGSGIGTAACQLAMGAAAAWVVARGAARQNAWGPPRLTGLLANAREGLPLLVRTLSLRAAIVLTVMVATRRGEVTLAGHQIVNSVWSLVAYGLDALAIAAQALIGKLAGAGDAVGARTVVRRTLQWGVLAGVVIGGALAASSPLVVAAFSSDPAVRRTTVVALLVTSALMPLAGWVFVLDGVLIGAGDGRYLAFVGMLTLVAYVPVAWWVATADLTDLTGLAWLWVAFGGWFMATRAITTGWRIRGEHWLVLGAVR